MLRIEEKCLPLFSTATLQKVQLASPVKTAHQLIDRTKTIVM